MGNRLSKIYTRTGDDGSTGLGDGSRVAKDDVRVEAYGTVDELNAGIGLLRAELPAAHATQACLGEIQHDLFDLGGELCIPGHRLLAAARVTTWRRKSTSSMQRCRPCANSSCPVAAAAPARPMSHAPCAGGRNAACIRWRTVAVISAPCRCNT